MGKRDHELSSTAQIGELPVRACSSLSVAQMVGIPNMKGYRHGFYLGNYSNSRKAIIFWDDTSTTEAIHPQNIGSPAGIKLKGPNKKYYEFVSKQVKKTYERKTALKIPFVIVESSDKHSAPPKKKKKQKLKRGANPLVFSCEIKNILSSAEYDGLTDDVYKFPPVERPSIDVWMPEKSGYRRFHITKRINHEYEMEPSNKTELGMPTKMRIFGGHPRLRPIRDKMQEDKDKFNKPTTSCPATEQKVPKVAEKVEKSKTEEKSKSGHKQKHEKKVKSELKPEVKVKKRDDKIPKEEKIQIEKTIAEPTVQAKVEPPPAPKVKPECTVAYIESFFDQWEAETTKTIEDNDAKAIAEAETAERKEVLTVISDLSKKFCCLDQNPIYKESALDTWDSFVERRAGQKEQFLKERIEKGLRELEAMFAKREEAEKVEEMEIERKRKDEEEKRVKALEERRKELEAEQLANERAQKISTSTNILSFTDDDSQDSEYDPPVIEPPIVLETVEHVPVAPPVAPVVPVVQAPAVAIIPPALIVPVPVPPNNSEIIDITMHVDPPQATCIISPPSTSPTPLMGNKTPLRMSPVDLALQVDEDSDDDMPLDKVILRTPEKTPPSPSPATPPPVLKLPGKRVEKIVDLVKLKAVEHMKQKNVTDPVIDLVNDTPTAPPPTAKPTTPPRPRVIVPSNAVSSPSSYFNSARDNPKRIIYSPRQVNNLIDRGTVIIQQPARIPDRTKSPDTLPHIRNQPSIVQRPPNQSGQLSTQFVPYNPDLLQPNKPIALVPPTARPTPKCGITGQMNCSLDCFEKETVHFVYSNSNDRIIGLLQKPRKYGWERAVHNAGTVQSYVVYTSGCGRQFRKSDMDQLNEELWKSQTRKLRMENFSFEPDIVVDSIPQELSEIQAYVGNLANEWLIKIRYNVDKKKKSKDQKLKDLVELESLPTTNVEQCRRDQEQIRRELLTLTADLRRLNSGELLWSSEITHNYNYDFSASQEPRNVAYFYFTRDYVNEKDPTRTHLPRLDVRYRNPLRLNERSLQSFLMENQLAFDTTKSNMVAFNRCSCTCTDGCMSAQCECKQATLRQFCRRNNLSEAEAFEKGYPQSGWYKNDLLQGLDTQLPFQDQIQIFECSKDCACMQQVKQLGDITCRNTLAYDGCRNMSFMISESITSFKSVYPRDISAYPIPKGTFYGATIIANKCENTGALWKRNWFHMPSHISYMVKEANGRSDVYNQCNLINVQVNGYNKIWFNAFFAHKFIGKSKDFRVYYPPPNCHTKRHTWQRDSTPLPCTEERPTEPINIE